jgi:multisubunit Na+/H+ antiporter MnhG subunit
MRWTDLNFRPEAKVLRQFALLWLVFFSGIGIFQWLARGHAGVGMTLGAIGCVLGILGLIWPKALCWLYVSCMAASFPIGWLLSQVMLAVLFYVIITPIALLFRLRGRDLLQRRRDPNRKSLWLPKSLPHDVRSYFRQY